MWCERDGETASGEKARAHPACRARGIGAYVYRRIYSFWLKERDKVRRNAASHEKHVKWKRQQQESCNIMQHATADRRTTARAIYLPETPYHPPASTTHPIEHSNPSVRRQIQKEEGENRKQHKRRRTSKKENVRLIVQPRTRTEKYSVPPVRPTAPARAALRGVHLHPIHSAAPVPGQYPGGGGAGETQAQCHGSVATQHAREKEGIQPREHEERGCAGSVCVHHSKSCLLLMQLRLVVGSGPFYPFFCSIPFVSCIRLPACLVLVALPFRFDLEIARRHPGQRTKMCQ